jgi:cationic amino acid transporter 1
MYKCWVCVCFGFVSSVNFREFGFTILGVGSTIGAGVYILVGTVAREHSGPALALSFLIAGISAALSAFCYAELSSRFPSAGSAYHYSYICIGEGVAWLIGWALILEYTIGGSTVARGISPNLVCSPFD